MPDPAALAAAIHDGCPLCRRLLHTHSATDIATRGPQPGCDACDTRPPTPTIECGSA